MLSNAVQCVISTKIFEMTDRRRRRRLTKPVPRAAAGWSPAAKNINHFIITNYNVKSPWRMNMCICNLFDYAAWNLKGSMSKQLRIPHNTNTTFFYGRLDMSQILLCVHKGISRQKSVRYIQLRSYETAAEHVYEWKWGHFDRVKSTFKILLASWNFYIVLKGFRSFNVEDLSNVSQRAAKLSAIKLWEWFNPRRSRMQVDWFEWGKDAGKLNSSA